MLKRVSGKDGLNAWSPPRKEETQANATVESTGASSESTDKKVQQEQKVADLRTEKKEEIKPVTVDGELQDQERTS